jgi:hypothetical protein
VCMHACMVNITYVPTCVYVELLVLLRRIRAVSGSNVGQDIDYPDSFFAGFLSPHKKMLL